MRVGVIRGDLAGGLPLMDLEVVSQYNPPTEPRGQERRIGRPDLGRISTLLVAMGSTATAADVVTATLPVGGPVDVSTATLTGLVGSGATADQLAALADELAPRIVETDAAVKSFQVGMMSKALKSTFNPDPSRHPKLADGPAISVVQDDGVTPFTAPLTAVTGAVHDSPSAGDITITGTGLGHPERMETVVRVTSADGTKFARVAQAILRRTPGGSLSATTIVVPAALLGGLGVAGSRVVVQYTSLMSTEFVVT